MPIPVSVTTISSISPTRRSERLTVPPGGVNLTALVRMFQTTC
jgi:hypothetical protein